MTDARGEPLICLPGFDGTSELFAPLRSALSNDLSLTLVRYSHERSLDDYLLTALSALPQGPCVLLAESFSGPIALTLMARHPERVRCAVLCATFAVSPFRPLARMASALPGAFFASSRLQRTSMLRLFCLNGAPERIPAAEKTLRSVGPSALRARLNALAEIDVRPLLARVSVPILYLRATHDRIVSASLSRALTDALPNVIVREIDGPHLLLQGRSELCAAEIVRFIAQTRTSHRSDTPAPQSRTADC